MESNQTFSGYLGPQFQLKLLWQLLADPTFAEKITPLLQVSYFDDDAVKRLFISIKNYFDDYGKVALIQNDSVEQAINKYNKSDIDVEILNSVIDKIKLYEESIINDPRLYDGDVVQKETFTFIIQQEYRRLADFINSKVKLGSTRKSEEIITEIENRVKMISEIGEDEDYGSEVFDDIDDVLVEDYRKPVPTGIGVVDDLTGGGLGRGEIGILLAGTGVGKTTFLTNCAHAGRLHGENVLQIVFEDTVKEIKRKNYALMSNTRLSEMNEKHEEVRVKVRDYKKKYKDVLGKHVIVRFKQEGITIPKIKNFIDRYQKKFGIKFGLIILDYLDCVESHQKSADATQGEIVVIKAFEAMAAELDVPCWSAIQANRSAYGQEFVGTSQMGGSIKRAQKTHFLMSVGKNDQQKLDGYANIQILKARFAQDGHTFKDCKFDNDSLEITIYADMPLKKKIPPAPGITEENKESFEEGMRKLQERKDTIEEAQVVEEQEVEEAKPTREEEEERMRSMGLMK